MAEISQVPQLIKDAGLIHKGNIENVVMYELPEHPGKTFSAKAEQIEGVDWLKDHAKAKIERYLASDAEYAKSTAAKVASTVAEAAHFAPGRAEAEIPGLIGKGAAKAMRKIITEFGSGWQGLDPGFKVQFQRGKLAGERLMTVSSGDDTVGMLTYMHSPEGIAHISSSAIFSKYRGKGIGKSMYAEAMKHASDEGAIRFRSDVTGRVSESAQQVWKSAEKAGIATPIPGEKGWITNLTRKQHLPSANQVAQASMARGEGTAISRAGTSEVTAILRNTSRIIRNAL